MGCWRIFELDSVLKNQVVGPLYGCGQLVHTDVPAVTHLLLSFKENQDGGNGKNPELS